MPACQRSSHSEARLLVPELGLRAEAGGMGCVLITAVDLVHTVVEGVAVGVGAGPEIKRLELLVLDESEHLLTKTRSS
eukprot:CAMPEP_0179447796 /NCGR_PEP_ID=MMETSP0799-20121207/31566_1 /TAXON_ID=46947 /ORGANISM="Geminigera cryophila, Strain CCMP2564" /LENGTH=77 /DNA_ID=CAMNT_0021238845 /DNA_START=114 /DNA_END=347 /DNA_ORIENTATION=-